VTGDIADQGIDTITVSKLAFNPLTPNLGGREERSGDTPDPGRDESLHSPDPRLIFTPTLPKGDSRGILRDTLRLPVRLRRIIPAELVLVKGSP